MFACFRQDDDYKLVVGAICHHKRAHVVQNDEYKLVLAATCLHKSAHFVQNDDHKLVVGASCPHKRAQIRPYCFPRTDHCCFLSTLDGFGGPMEVARAKVTSTVPLFSGWKKGDKRAKSCFGHRRFTLEKLRFAWFWAK